MQLAPDTAMYRAAPSAIGRDQVALAAASLLALALGVAVYVFDRHTQAWLLAAAWRVEATRGLLPVVLSDCLPSMCHAYAFSLLTALWLPPGRRSALFACGGWFAINALFEAGQHPALAPQLAAAMPAWFAAVPVLDHLAGYFVRGSFGWGDIAAAATGAAAAGWTLMRLQQDRSTRRKT